MVLIFGDFLLDTNKRELRQGSELVAIEPQVFDLLLHLIANRDRVVSKDDLVAAVWGGRIVSDSAISSRLTAVRQAVGDSGHEQRLIRTIPRKGFRFIGEVREERQSTDRAAARPTQEKADSATAMLRGTSVLEGNAAAPSGSEKSAPTKPSGDVQAAVAASAQDSRTDAANRRHRITPPSYGPAARSVALLGAVLVLFSAVGLATLREPQPESPAQRNGFSERNSRCDPVLATVLVLPFTAPKDTGPAAELAEKISDDVRGYLSRSPFLRVLPRQGAWRVASSSASTASAAPAAEYTVEGKIEPGNGNLRLNVHLLHEGAQAQVWSSTFEHAPADWPLKQDELARHLTHTVHLEMVRRQGSGSHDNVDELSIQQLLRGGWATMMGGPGVSALRLQHAEKLFVEVLRRDPACTSAMIGLAGSKVVRATNLIGNRDKLSAEVDALLRKAQYRGPDNFLVHFYFGILHNMENNVPAALAAYDLALELNPTFAPSHAYRGRLLIKMSRYEEALRSLDQAFRLTRKIGAWHVWHGIVQLELGDDDAAGESFRRALAAIPDNPYANATMASYYALRGQLKDAAPHVDKARRLTPDKSDQWRLSEFNRGPDDQPLPNRLGKGLRLAFEAHPDTR